MKIAWFTPFDQKSAIGRCSERIVAELSRHALVELWHPEGDRARETTVRTIRFRADTADTDRLASYDLIVYNFGNHLAFHRDIFLVSRRWPGLCILHDFVMHHFFAGYYLEELHDPQAYLEAIRRVYGESGRRRAEDGIAGRRARVWETEEVAEYPLFEDTLKGVYGVVVHSNFFLDRVRKVYSGPSCKLWLPYESLPAGPNGTRQNLEVPDDAVLLVTVGQVNPNKQVNRVIEALAGLRPVSGKWIYAVLGAYERNYGDLILAEVRRLGLQGVVRMPGHVPDKVLQAYLTHADICVNLRWPATEGASASAIEEMLHGKPVVVSDTGFYSELPDDCVVKIRPGQETQELPETLRRLMSDADWRRQLGDRAREFTGRHCRADLYADGLIEFAREVRHDKPMIQLADRVGGELNLMGATASMEILDTVSRECIGLFGED